MTSLLERPLGKAKPKQPKGEPSVLSGLPQVNLLPPEVRAARGLRSTKRLLGLALIGVLVLCVLLYTVAIASSKSADSDLHHAQGDTVALTLEQGKYAQVPLVLGELTTAQKAQVNAMSTDVLWKPYLDAITAELPADVSLDSIAITVATPMAASGLTTAPLQQPAVGQITFKARSVTVPDAAKWMDALDSIPGFGDAWVSSASITQDPDTGVYYGVQATVRVNDGAFSHRFDETAKEK